MRFTRDQLRACYGMRVPDLLPNPLRLLFVGINPSLSSAAAGAHFATRGNRFYPALAAAGIVLPNPSGLNAHETVGSLAAAYAEVARAAGIPPALTGP